MWCWRRSAELWLSQHSSVKQRVNLSDPSLGCMNTDTHIHSEHAQVSADTQQPACVFPSWNTESTEDLCLGCPTLLPLNDTTALDFVHASLATFNNMTVDVTYTVLEVGRMSSQVGQSIICSVQSFTWLNAPARFKLYLSLHRYFSIPCFRLCLAGQSMWQNML